MKWLTWERKKPWMYLTDPAHALPVQQAAAVKKVSKMLVYIKKEIYL